MLLRVRHAIGDNAGDRAEAPVAPQPFAAREIGSERSALAIRSMTAGTRSTLGLAVEDTIAERDLRRRGAGGNRQGGGLRLRASVGMDAFRRDGGAAR